MSDKKRPTSYFYKLAFWKRGSSERWNKSSINAKGNCRKNLPSFPAPKPPSNETSEIKCKLTYSGADDFAASGYYDTVGGESILSKRGLNNTYLRPIDNENSSGSHYQAGEPGNEEHLYLEMVAEMDKASQDIALDKMLVSKEETKPPPLPPKSLALHDEKDVEREKALNTNERVLALIENQKVTQKTLFVNYENPAIPPRRPTLPHQDRRESIDIAAGEYTSCAQYKMSQEDQIDGNTTDRGSIGSSKTCPDVVCIREVPDSISKEDMTKYLEKKMSISDDFFNVIPGEKGLVIVEFFKKIDLKTLDNALKSESAELDFCQVYTPKSVLVSSSELVLDDTTLKQYFHRFENLGKITKLTPMDYGMMDVTFESHEAVYGICANWKHCIRDKQVYVSPLYKCKFGHVWHKELHEKINLPDDIHLENMDPLLASLIHSSTSVVQCFDRKLLKTHAKLTIGKDKNDIVIKCLLTSESPGVNVHAKQWREKTSKFWENIVNKLISKEEIHVSEEHMERVKKRQRKYEEEGIEGIFVEFHDDPGDFWIEIIGFDEKVEKVCKCYRNFIKHVEEQVQLPSRQIDRMQQEGLFEELESNNDVVIDKKFGQGHIIITGVQEDVDNTKDEIFSNLRTWTEKAKRQYTTKKIQEEADEQHLYEELDNVKDEQIYVNSEPTYEAPTKDDPKMTCRHGTTIKILSGELGRQKADVLVCSTNSDLKLGIAGVGKNLLQHGGDDLQNECDKKYPSGIGFDQIATIPGGKLECRCIYLGRLRNWIEGQSQYAKTILCNFVYDCLIKAASKKGLQSVAFPALGTGALGYPIESVAEMMFKGVMNFDAESKKSLDVSFVIYHKDTKTLNAFEDHRQLMTKMNPYITPRCHFDVIIEGISLPDKKVDVMVCNALKNLEFVWGALLNAIRQKGGADMENDCRTRYPNGIETDKLAVVNPGGLPCSRIYFGVLPSYKNDPHSAEKALHKLVYDSLDMASNCGKSTIAFPPMGTGILEYPHQRAAGVMYNAIKDFDKKTKLYTLKEIYFTILPTDLKSWDAFCVEHNAQK